MCFNYSFNDMNVVMLNFVSLTGLRDARIVGKIFLGRL